MSSLFETLTQQLGGGALDQISGQLGTDRPATERALPAALGTLMGALAGNSKRREGAEALDSALSRDHDGSILDDLRGFLSDPQSGNGDGILKHVLGSKRSVVESGLGQATGLDAGSTGQLLSMLAPIVMGALGKTKQQNGLDAGGLADLLSGERRQIETRAPKEFGALGQLLDMDGDGEITDDVAELGGGLLKSFLGKGR